MHSLCNRLIEDEWLRRASAANACAGLVIRGCSRFSLQDARKFYGAEHLGDHISDELGRCCACRAFLLQTLCPAACLPGLCLTPGAPTNLAEDEGELEVERSVMKRGGKGAAPTIGQVWSREGLECAEDEHDHTDSLGDEDEDAGMGAAGLDLMGFTRRPAKRSAQSGACFA
jgi:hypothetical protein